MYEYYMVMGHCRHRAYYAAQALAVIPSTEYMHTEHKHTGTELKDKLILFVRSHVFTIHSHRHNVFVCQHFLHQLFHFWSFWVFFLWICARLFFGGSEAMHYPPESSTNKTVIQDTPPTEPVAILINKHPRSRKTGKWKMFWIVSDIFHFGGRSK